MNVNLILTFLLLLNFGLVNGQNLSDKWYSESENDGIVIQNSFPKGGPYKGPITKNYHHSYLVFYSRVFNNTNKPLELSLYFSGDSAAIPQSTDTFVKLFFPEDSMSFDKENLFSYGLNELETIEGPTKLVRKIDAKEDCMFYVVAFFYQTNKEAWKQERGGNRGELILEGKNLYYRMPPQIDALSCGSMRFLE